MRIIGNIPHPSIKITVFSMNDKFIIKLEAGPLEQVYKLKETDIAGMEAINELLDDEFMKRVVEGFNEMYLSLKNALQKKQK